ncbi:hypothetical protein IX324_002035 [Bacteroides pyogenes]|nr:hypothetical protein [Bacteroides pyogenes]
MKKLEFVLNLCFYHFYLFLKTINAKLTHLFFAQLYNLSIAKRRTAKFGIKDPHKYTMEIENNPDNGVVVNVSFLLFEAWLVLIIYSITNIMNTIFQNEIYKFIFNTPLVIITCFILLIFIVLILTKVFLEHHSKYLIYSRYFRSRNKEIKIKNAIHAILIYLFSVILIILAYSF